MTEEQIKEALRLASAAAGISYEFGYSRCGPDTAGRFEQQIACADSALEAYLRTIGTEPVQSVNAELMVALKAARVFMQHAESCGDSPSYNHEPDACGCGAEHAIDFVESAIARAESAIETPAKVSPCAGHAAQQEVDEAKICATCRFLTKNGGCQSKGTSYNCVDYCQWEANEAGGA